MKSAPPNDPSEGSLFWSGAGRATKHSKQKKKGEKEEEEYKDGKNVA